MSNLKRLTYAESFRADPLDALDGYAYTTANGVLRGLNGCAKIDDERTYMGIAGASDKYLFLHTDKALYKFDGEKASHIMTKIPAINPVSKDARYEIYRNAAYVAFDDDGVIRFDESAENVKQRWAYADGAQDVAVVNERIVMLTENGTVLRFAECGGRVFSDVEIRQGNPPAPTVTLPTAAQAICRLGLNTLYVLGDTCYKATFSADEQEIKLRPIASGLGVVALHSVAQVGDSIVFAAANRLYRLRNDKITPVFGALSSAIRDFSAVRARAFNGFYALTVPHGNGRRTCLCDVNDESLCAVLWKDASDVTRYGATAFMLGLDGTLMREVEGEFAPLLYVRSRIDFGVNSVKYLRRLYITAKYDVDVTISNEQNSARRYRVKGSDRPQSIAICGKGKEFRVEISSQGATEVSALSFTAETYKEAYYGN